MTLGSDVVSDSTRLSSKSSSENKRAWEKTADKYIRNCHKFEIKIDPSVVIALQTGWDSATLLSASSYWTQTDAYSCIDCFFRRWTILQPTKAFNEGALLPLMEILEDNGHIKKLNLASSGMHDARCFQFHDYCLTFYDVRRIW